MTVPASHLCTWLWKPTLDCRSSHHFGLFRELILPAKRQGFRRFRPHTWRSTAANPLLSRRSKDWRLSSLIGSAVGRMNPVKLSAYALIRYCLVRTKNSSSCSSSRRHRAEVPIRARGRGSGSGCALQRHVSEILLARNL